MAVASIVVWTGRKYNIYWIWSVISTDYIRKSARRVERGGLFISVSRSFFLSFFLSLSHSYSRFLHLFNPTSGAVWILLRRVNGSREQNILYKFTNPCCCCCCYYYGKINFVNATATSIWMNASCWDGNSAGPIINGIWLDWKKMVADWELWGRMERHIYEEEHCQVSY